MRIKSACRIRVLAKMGNSAVKVSSARICATDGRTEFFIFGKLADSEFFCKRSEKVCTQKWADGCNPKCEHRNLSENDDGAIPAIVFCKTTVKSDVQKPPKSKKKGGRYCFSVLPVV